MLKSGCDLRDVVGNRHSYFYGNLIESGLFGGEGGQEQAEMGGQYTVYPGDVEWEF